jgi:hypothetical protein
MEIVARKDILGNEGRGGMKIARFRGRNRRNGRTRSGEEGMEKKDEKLEDITPSPTRLDRCIRARTSMNDFSARMNKQYDNDVQPGDLHHEEAAASGHHQHAELTL